MRNFACALTCYNYRKDNLELEDDVILLLDVLRDTDEVVIVAESAEMTETAVVEVQHERVHSKEKRRFKSDFFLL